MPKGKNNPTQLPAPGIASAYDADDLPRRRFAWEIARRGIVNVDHDDFAGEVDRAALRRLGRPVLVRRDTAGNTAEALLRLPGGGFALIDGDWGRVYVDVADDDDTRRAAGLARIRAALARPPDEPDSVSFAFWCRSGRGGGSIRHRSVTVPTWQDARANYPSAVAGAMDQLAALERPRNGGGMLVWSGPPGTGKTWALRALARAWRGWCDVHAVLDPGTLLGASPTYLLDVLTWEDGDDGDRFRLLVLEDAGDLLDHTAGEPLGTLLNVTDGLLGQGTRLIVLVTTNNPPHLLHPAVRRPGRCLAEVAFVPFPAQEANAWLEGRGSKARVAHAATLAELYALAGGGEAAAAGPAPGRVPFGFARAIR